MVRLVRLLFAGWMLLVSRGEAMDLREARLADLETARSDYVLKSKAFTMQTRQDAFRLIDRLEDRAASLSNAQFLLGAMEIAAAADNGHDSLDLGDGAWIPPTRLPLRLIWFPEGIVVARAAPEFAELLGAKVVRLEGLSADDLLARLRPLSGGTDTYRKWDLMWVIENGGMLNALGIGNPDRLRFELRLNDGRIVTRSIAFVGKSRLPSGADPARYWSPEPLVMEQNAGWRSANDAQPEPLYLEDPDRLYRSVSLPELDGLYIQYRANWNERGQDIAAFNKSAEARLKAERPRNVVLDLRFDVGGDIDQTAALLRSIARHRHRRIYILVGRYTFSAGIVAAALVKHDARAVRIVGEEPADRLRWWSEIDVTCLKHTHLCLRGTHGLWDLAKGCAREALCYGDRYRAVVGSLKPDIDAPLTAQAWLAGRDPGMEAVQRDIDRRNR